MDGQMDMFSAAADEPPKETPTWRSILKGEREQPYFKGVLKHIESERAAGKLIFPKNSDVFNALHFTPFSEVQVVILGQDPYHGLGQAHGLSFSVPVGISKPPSLINIFKELDADLGLPTPNSGCLTGWARQGVLLLNAVLTVEAHRAGSHAGIGWETFTDNIISALSSNRRGLVFLLWGAYAQKKGQLVERSKHSVLKAPHPSPLSAHRGFFGCRHFSQTNEILHRQGLSEINWADLDSEGQ